MVYALLLGLVIMRSSQATLVDRFELSFPLPDLPRPAVEKYRAAPIQSLYLEIDFEDTDADRDGSGWFNRAEKPAPESDRYCRARCWASEE
jgi:hypothetical protein